MSRIRTHLPLVVILLLALALRLGWVLRLGDTIDPGLPDQREYYEIARNHLAGNGLAFFDARFSQEVRAFRMPGYPLFLALCIGHVPAARIAQAVLDTSTVLAAFLLARRWLPGKTALIAALLVALNPFLIYFTGLLLTETLFTCLLTWGLVLLVWRRNFLWGGLVLALSIHVRPGAALLPLLLGILAVFVIRRFEPPGPQRWFKLPVGTTMLLLTVLALLPWAVRNKVVLGHWVWLSTGGGIARCDGFHADATGASDQRFVTGAEMRVRLRPLGELDRDRYLNEQASKWTSETMRKEPMRLAELSARKAARTWSPVPLSAEYGSRPLYRAVGWAYSAPLLALACAGLVSRSIDRPGKWLLLAVLVYLTMGAVATVGSLRYRMPGEPILAVLAAAAAQSALQWLSRPRYKREPENLAEQL